MRAYRDQYASLFDGGEGCGKAAGLFGKTVVFLAKIRHALHDFRTARLQSFEDQVLQGVVMQIGVGQAVVHNAVDDIEVQRLAILEVGELPLERIKQFGQAGMVAAQRFDNTGHGFLPVR